jgi:hypothetical protein
VEVATAVALRLAVDAALAAVVQFAVDAAPAAVLRLLSPLPLIHGHGEQAMGDRWPGCASTVLLKRIAERAPASPTPTSQ